MAKQPRIRIDRLLVDRGLCESRTRAQALILAGKVLADDQIVDKPGCAVPPSAALRIKGPDHPYVSRGGVKLEGALDIFGVTVRGRIVLDIGASTGGFSDCVLHRGASHVYAVDVGYGQLAWKLRQDLRVTVLDRQNIRHLKATRLPRLPDFVVADCSFISLAKVLPHVPQLLHSPADVVILVKPQFEVGAERVGKGGIVRNEADRLAALASVGEAATSLGFARLGQCVSPITGRDGNVEFFLWLGWKDDRA
ncbi:MAG: TlyA family RNA methyltransferase [Nannocystaceae bacterium]